MRFSLTGLVAAVHTPLRPDGSLSLDQVERIVEHQVGQRLGGIMACGSTGEGPLLTTTERRAVAALSPWYVKPAPASSARWSSSTSCIAVGTSRRSRPS